MRYPGLPVVFSLESHALSPLMVSAVTEGLHETDWLYFVVVVEYSTVTPLITYEISQCQSDGHESTFQIIYYQHILIKPIRL